MKKYTIDDLKTFERDERGYLICPTGDYTAIKEFGKLSKFGDGCELAWCSDKGVARVFHYLYNGMIQGSKHKDDRFHPTQKPTQL